MYHKNRKRNVDYMEFQDGYVLVERSEILTIIESYRTRTLRRNELRVYAGSLEHRTLHKRSRVDLARIVNCKSKIKGIRRLSNSQIERSCNKVREVLKYVSEDSSGRRIAVSRKMLRHAARGAATSNEMIVMFYYCLRRLQQRRQLVRLQEGERYARFTYRDLEKQSGIPRANICRAVGRLRDKGIINTVWVAKQNENQFGLLFVDGPLVSLTCQRQGTNRRKKPSRNKTTTPTHQINNPPGDVSTTLKNDNPKKDDLIMIKIDETKTGETYTTQSEWDRIILRAEQMKAEWIDQAA